MDSALVIAVETEIAALLAAFSILRHAGKSYKPSSHEYISSAYLSARSFGIAPFTTANPSLARSSRKSPKTGSFPSRRMRTLACGIVTDSVTVVDMMDCK